MPKYRSLASHNAACNEIFYRFQDCEAEHSFRRFIGYCHDLQKEMQACIKEQREIQRAQNYQLSLERMEKMRSAQKQENVKA